MKKNANKLFLAAGLLAVSAVLLTGCGSKKKTDAADSVIKISTAPEPTATPDPEKVDPDAVTSNGNLTMVNEYLAENGGAALGSAAVTPTPAAAASDGSSGNSGTDTSDDSSNTDTSAGDSSDEDGTDSSDIDDGSYDGEDAGYSDESGYDDSSYDDGSGDDGSDSYDDTGEGDYDGE